MRRVLPLLLLVLALALGTGCNARVLSHSQTDAAAKAEDFLTALLVDKDAAAAYPLLSETTRAKMTQVDLAKRAESLPGYGQVTEVVATAYEPIPGRAAMIIYAEGRGGPEPAYFALQMSGTADTGYTEEHLAVGSGPPAIGGNIHALP
jgi:hypothetical protein